MFLPHIDGPLVAQSRERRFNLLTNVKIRGVKRKVQFKVIEIQVTGYVNISYHEVAA